MYVYERMTKNVATVTPDCTISKAFQVLFEKKHSQLPVISDDGKLAGLITEKLLTEVSPSKATSLSVFEINYLLSKTKVKDIMKTNVFTIQYDNLIEEAALIMKENDIGSLPVIDKDEKLVGIVTRVDIFSAFIALMGVHESGTRIVIDVEDHVGTLADIAAVIKEFGINIKHISNYQDGEHTEIIVKIASTDSDALIEELKKRGYSITSVHKMM